MLFEAWPVAAAGACPTFNRKTRGDRANLVEGVVRICEVDGDSPGLSVGLGLGPGLGSPLPPPKNPRRSRPRQPSPMSLDPSRVDQCDAIENGYPTELEGDAF